MQYFVGRISSSRCALLFSCGFAFLPINARITILIGEALIKPSVLFPSKHEIVDNCEGNSGILIKLEVRIYRTTANVLETCGSSMSAEV